MPEVMKKCPICGTKFPAVGRRRFDTDECKFVAYRRRKKAAAALILRPCKHCGESYQPATANQLYCTEKCAKAADNERQRQRQRFEAEAKEILRLRKTGEIEEAEFKAAADRLQSGKDASDVGRKPTKSERDLEQAIYDLEATERAKVPRRDFIDLAGYFGQPKPPSEGEGQGPSLGVLQKIRDAEESKK